MNVGRFLRTIRYLTTGQISNRFARKLRAVRVDSVEHVERRLGAGLAVLPVPKRRTLDTEWSFTLLNKSIDVSDSADWNDPSQDKLMLYNLHYLDELSVEDANDRIEQHDRLIKRWISDNPPASGNGWEPYPLSLRIVNIVKWLYQSGSQRAEIEKSVFLQARALSQQLEFHLLGNHLLANAKALVFAGQYFAGEEADQWRKTGIDVLKEQLNEQILPDGAHFELSPMYHAIILEDLLDVVNLLSIDKAFDELDELVAVLPKMAQWLKMMTHADGGPAHFNDSVRGIAAPYHELKAYAHRLAIDFSEPEHGRMQHATSSGYSCYDDNKVRVLVDMGHIGPDYQPAHGHCDCLSFELSHLGDQVFVNSGISTYNIGDRRDLERSTISHNTVSVAGAEQSEIWSAFRVGRRARPFSVGLGDNAISASHDGYRKIGVFHNREFRFSEEEILIVDTLHSIKCEDGIAHFHFHPDVKPIVDVDRIEVCGIRVNFDLARSISLDDYEYCLGFNKRTIATKVSVKFAGQLKTRIRYMVPS